jgi:hypothetical protein
MIRRGRDSALWSATVLLPSTHSPTLTIEMKQKKPSNNHPHTILFFPPAIYVEFHDVKSV